MKQYDNIFLSLFIITFRFLITLLKNICINIVILQIYLFYNIFLQENFEKFSNMHS